RLALAEDVAAPLDRADRGGIGRRPADAELLELLDQRRFREARRRRGLVALRIERHGEEPRAGLAHHALADAHLRQHRLLLIELGVRIVAALDVGAAEAGELDRLPRRGEDAGLAVRR